MLLFLVLPVLATPSACLDSLHSTLEPGFVPKWKDKSTSHMMQQYKMRERYICKINKKRTLQDCSN